MVKACVKKGRNYPSVSKYLGPFVVSDYAELKFTYRDK
jgi:hypothetical protein